MVLDKIDWKIIKALNEDARAPINEIAKKARLSKTGAHYRIKNLEESGVIKGYKTKINISKLGLNTYSIYLKLFDLNNEEELTVLEDLKSISQIRWLVSCAGKWDLMLSIAVKNNSEFQKILSLILNKFKGKILEYDVAIILSTRKTWLKDYKNLNDELLETEDTNESIDEKDELILSELQKNARARIVDIAKIINLSAEAVNYRIKNLIKRKIIHSFELSVDVDKLNYGWYQLQILLSDPMSADKMLSKIISTGNVAYVAKVVGKWNFEIHLYCEDMRDFRQKLIEIRTILSSNIKDYELNIITAKHS